MNDEKKSDDAVAAPANLTLPQPPDQSRPIISQVPINSGQVLSASPLNIVQSYSGPIPHPDTLRAYDTAVHDGAERVFRMAESDLEQQHSIANRQMSLSEKNQADEFFLKKLTAIAATSLLACGFAMVAVLAFTGHLVGSGITGALIAALSAIGTIAGRKQPPAPKD